MIVLLILFGCFQHVKKSSQTVILQTLSIALSFLRNLKDCFLGYMCDASSMTKETVNSNATNTFYCFVIPEESQGCFLVLFGMLPA